MCTDPGFWSGFADQNPDPCTRPPRRHVAAICIRQLSDSEAVLAGGRSRERWHERPTVVDRVFAPDGGELTAALEKRDLL